MDSLETYRSKRDFGKTPEPSGRARTRRGKKLHYVVQKHAARALHYDFRLELDGVLLSWAVPKGPSLDPSTKRLAMQTEDHPLDYRRFEGVIPEGEYGAGAVLVWDRGTWEPHGDAREALRRGHLEFELHGQKLAGRWHLVRARSAERGRRAWLLFKGKDEAAARGRAGAIVDREPSSVLTGRDLVEIARASTNGRVRAHQRGSQGVHTKRTTSKASQSSRTRETGKTSTSSRTRTSGKASRPRKASKTRRAGKTSTASKASRTRKKGKASKASRTRRASKATEGAPTELHEGSLPAGLRLTHPDRVLFPEARLTKLGLAEYYAAVAERMLPHIADRPLTLVRCPEGYGSECFYQKHAGRGVPGSVGRVEIREGAGVTKEGSREYMVVHDLEGLLGLAQMSVLEIHVWGSRRDRLEQQDRLVFDVDPDPALGWEHVARAAESLRDRLADLGLKSFLQTTGGKGLHVVLPVARRLEWDAVKAFCHGVVLDLEREEPQRYVTKMSKAARRGKVYLDYLRNSRGATAIAPFSTRARPAAPVAVPIRWDEIRRVRSDEFTVSNLSARLSNLRRDPFEGWFELRQSITLAMRRSVGARR